MKMRIHEDFRANINLNGEMAKPFLLKLGTEAGCLRASSL